MGQFGSKGGLSRIVAKDESDSSGVEPAFYFRRVVFDSESGEFQPSAQEGSFQDEVGTHTQEMFDGTRETYRTVKQDMD
jgi:hypothetical protein